MYNYKILYSIFGEYNQIDHSSSRQKINEIERRLNLILKEKTSTINIEFLNPIKGKISKKLTNERKHLLTDLEINVLSKMADKAIRTGMTKY